MRSQFAAEFTADGDTDEVTGRKVLICIGAKEGVAGQATLAVKVKAVKNYIVLETVQTPFLKMLDFGAEGSVKVALTGVSGTVSAEMRSLF